MSNEQLEQIRELSVMMGRVSVCWNAVGALLDEVDRLRAERGSLYRQVDFLAGEPCQWVGVHPVQWQQEWGEPMAGFVEVG